MLCHWEQKTIQRGALHPRCANHDAGRLLWEKDRTTAGQRDMNAVWSNAAGADTRWRKREQTGRAKREDDVSLERPTATRIQIELLIMNPPPVNLCVHEASEICRVW